MRRYFSWLFVGPKFAAMGCSSDAIPSALNFENGRHIVNLLPALTSPQETWALGGYAVLRNVLGLETIVREGLPEGDIQAHAELMASVVQAELVKLDEEYDTTWSVENVIRRDGEKDYYVGSRVHRDIDEHAWNNLIGHGVVSIGIINVWVPLISLQRDTLAWLPANKSDSQWSASFHNVSPTDRTGLNFHAAHADEWVYAPKLKPGDALAWKSTLVYHSAAELPSGESGRRSVDFRLYFK
eukprot:GEMP01073455.1.p1 GENE.GEMP01073455.1~~GEMP01073455.1.p1  ORF type:complete len:267 (+),score=33.51 GEMP01073455.1:80-802(+)